VAADELGFTFQVELPCWIHNYGEAGQEKRDAFLREEMHRIFAEYGNHPSFAFLSMGNEPGPRDKLDFIHSLVKEAKAMDPRRLYVSGSGWGFGLGWGWRLQPIRHRARAAAGFHATPQVTSQVPQGPLP
jgi:hypothetical protein